MECGDEGGVTTPTSRRCSGRISNSGKERCTKTDLPSSEGGPGSYRRIGVCVMFWDPERIHQKRWGCQENRLADMLCYLHDDLESISKPWKQVHLCLIWTMFTNPSQMPEATQCSHILGFDVSPNGKNGLRWPQSPFQQPK